MRKKKQNARIVRNMIRFSVNLVASSVRSIVCDRFVCGRVNHVVVV